MLYQLKYLCLGSDYGKTGKIGKVELTDLGRNIDEMSPARMKLNLLLGFFWFLQEI